jgi:hypothetical protein
MEKSVMATATATVRPKRTRILRATLAGWASRHEFGLTVLFVVTLGVFLTALLGLSTSPEVNSLSVNLGITALSATITVIVALVTALVAFDKGERESGARWARSYRLRVAQATSDHDTQHEEIQNLTRLVLALVVNDDERHADYSVRTCVASWIANGHSVSEYADAFHNGEGIGLDDMVRRDNFVVKYLNSPTK